MRKIRQILGWPARRLARFTRPGATYAMLAICCAGSLAISICAVELDLRVQAGTSKFALFGASLLFLSALVVPIYVVGISIVAAWLRRGKADGLGIFLAAYLVIIFCFAGFYYFVVYMEDYNDCVGRFCHFEAEFAMGQYDRQHPILDPPESRRAFDGMRYRLWQLGELNETVAEEMHDIQDLIHKDFEAVIHPLPGAKLPVFAECLHFSVVSLTLFGYGPVTPRDWKIKMANSLEIVTGTLLLVVLLGMLFADWGNPPKEEGALPNKVPEDTARKLADSQH